MGARQLRPIYQSVISKAKWGNPQKQAIADSIDRKQEGDAILRTSIRVKWRGASETDNREYRNVKADEIKDRVGNCKKNAQHHSDILSAHTVLLYVIYL